MDQKIYHGIHEVNLQPDRFNSYIREFCSLPNHSDLVRKHISKNNTIPMLSLIPHDPRGFSYSLRLDIRFDDGENIDIFELEDEEVGAMELFTEFVLFLLSRGYIEKDYFRFTIMETDLPPCNSSSVSYSFVRDTLEDGRQVIFTEVMRDCFEYYSWNVSGITEDERKSLLQANDYLRFFKGIDPHLLPKRMIDGSLLLSDLDIIPEENYYDSSF